ncbi:MAG: dockerin type I repeat-containing protein, partial [Porcipelethomonas sp.]
KVGYYLKDSDSAYKVSQTNANRMSMLINYENCIIESEMASGKSVIFDPAGLAQLEGEATDYSINMVYNEGHYPTDWYKISVSGTNANNVTLEQVEHGYVLSSDNLEGVTVAAENDSVNAQCSFSTEYKKVFIYEIDERTIGISVDTNDDGVYDTEVETDTPAADDTDAVIGDANQDGKLNVRDAAFIAQKLAQGKSGELPKAADYNEDGNINVRDAAAIAKFLATGEK